MEEIQSTALIREYLLPFCSFPRLTFPRTVSAFVSDKSPIDPYVSVYKISGHYSKLGFSVVFIKTEAYNVTLSLNSGQDDLSPIPIK